MNKKLMMDKRMTCASYGTPYSSLDMNWNYGHNLWLLRIFCSAKLETRDIGGATSIRSETMILLHLNKNSQIGILSNKQISVRSFFFLCF